MRGFKSIISGQEIQLYHYLGNSRLQLWFDTPNICASFLSMTTILTIGLFLCCTGRKTVTGRILLLASTAAIIVQEYLLAVTYSRGGYVALAAGLLFIWLFNRKREVLFFLLSFAAILIFTSNGINRVHSIAATGDGSIYNRFLLWSGGLSIIADNYFYGVGAGSAGSLYTAWYQPLWLNEHYGSLANDYLTIGASYGIFVLFACLAVVLTIFYCGIQLWVKTQSRLLLAVLAAIAAYLVSAVFSTFYKFHEIYWFLGILISIILISTLYSFLFRSFRPKIAAIVLPCACAAIFCAALFFSGWLLNRNIPYTFKYSKFQHNGRSIKVCEAYPKAEHKAAIIYLFNPESGFFNFEDKRLEAEIRTTVSPRRVHVYEQLAEC